MGGCRKSNFDFWGFVASITTMFFIKGGFKSEETGGFLLLQNKYSKSLSWAENLNTLLTVLGGKFKFFPQDSDLEYLSWQCKNPPVSSDLKPPLKGTSNGHFCASI